MVNISTNVKWIWDNEKEEYKSFKTKLTFWSKNVINEKVCITIIKCILWKETKEPNRLWVRLTLSKTNVIKNITNIKEVKTIPKIILLITTKIT
jgi:hypothetical protein